MYMLLKIAASQQAVLAKFSKVPEEPFPSPLASLKHHGTCKPLFSSVIMVSALHNS